MEAWTLTWTRLAPMNKVEAEAIPTSTAGVYRLSYKAEDGNYYVFYIGETSDIREQILSHISDGEQNICIKNFLSTKECFFRYAQISEEYARKAITRQAYNHYQPQCNLQLPDGRDDVQGNLTN